MTAEDLDEVLMIERLSFPNPWTRAQFESELKNPVSFAYTLKEAPRRGGNPRVSAYIVYWIVQGEAHILNIAVAPEQRRKGLATWILETTLDFMRKNLVFEVFLEVRKSNAAALRLYRKLGFKETFERKNYYGDEDAIVMVLVFPENL